MNHPLVLFHRQMEVCRSANFSNGGAWRSVVVRCIIVCMVLL